MGRIREIGDAVRAVVTATLPGAAQVFRRQRLCAHGRHRWQRRFCLLRRRRPPGAGGRRHCRAERDGQLAKPVAGLAARDAGRESPSLRGAARRQRRACVRADGRAVLAAGAGLYRSRARWRDDRDLSQRRWRGVGYRPVPGHAHRDADDAGGHGRRRHVRRDRGAPRGRSARRACASRARPPTSSCGSPEKKGRLHGHEHPHDAVDRRRHSQDRRGQPVPGAPGAGEPFIGLVLKSRQDFAPAVALVAGASPQTISDAAYTSGAAAVAERVSISMAGQLDAQATVTAQLLRDGVAFGAIVSWLSDAAGNFGGTIGPSSRRPRGPVRTRTPSR